MRVHFDNVAFGSTNGPNNFGTRLAKELINQGHDIASSGDSADVSLVFIERSGQQLAKKIVQRLDGIWFAPDEFKSKNVRIKDLYDTADSVIWQSMFDRRVTCNLWHERPGTVIHNGIEQAPVRDIKIASLMKIRQTYDQIFVCSANWHSQKRLKKNIELFDHIRRTQHPNSCIIVLGSNPDVVTSDPHVLYAGNQPAEVCAEVFAVSNWMFHLAWADHCPNVVVEAISQGTPVVCSNVGGTKEIVSNFGLVVDEQVPYDHGLFDYKHPPDIDVSRVKLPPKEWLGPPSDIDIRNVAKQYVSEFERVINA